MPRKTDHKDRIRQRILDRSAELFRKRGFEGVSIDNLMAAADLTRGGFYAHFSSKSDLFAQTTYQDSALPVGPRLEWGWRFHLHSIGRQRLRRLR